MSKTFLDGDLLTASDINQYLVTPDPVWWTGKTTGSVSHTASRYKSFNFATKVRGEGLTPGTSGDCLTVPAGVYDLSAGASWPSNTDGYRELLLALDPSATAVDNASVDLTYGTQLLAPTTLGTSRSANTIEIPPQTVRLTATTKIMVRGYHNSTVALTVPAGGVWLTIKRVGV